MPSLWSYTTGRKGINRIRVYEREPDGPIQIQWWDRDGRHRETLKNSAGFAILDKQLATDIAEAAAASQRKRREAHLAAELLGRPVPRTFRQLVETYHKAKGPGWSFHHRRIQKGLSEFWLAALGDSTLNEVTPAIVQNIVRRKATVRKWTTRTQQKYLRYIVDAFGYAQRKLKWITESENLSAVEIPRPGGVSRPYTLAEVAALLRVGGGVDPRCGALLWLAWTAGRRLNAIRMLRTDAVDGDSVLFPSDTDKSRRSGQVFLGPSGMAALDEILSRPAVLASGLLFPAGNLAHFKANRIPVSDTLCRKWLRRAEDLAGVEHVSGRGYHGIKRRFATASGADAAAEKQSGTDRSTLRRIYEQDDPEPKRRLAEQLEAMVRK